MAHLLQLPQGLRAGKEYSGTQIWDNDLSCWFAATILAKYNLNGNPIQETVYLNTMPVAALKQVQNNTLPH